MCLWFEQVSFACRSRFLDFAGIYAMNDGPQTALVWNEEKKGLTVLRLASKDLIIRNILLSIAFVMLCLILSQPSVIFVSHLGWTAWYPVTGLILGLLLGVSPRYALLVCLADAFCGWLLYRQPLWTFGETLGSCGVAVWYGAAAYVLRGPLRIDSRLRRGRDVVLYICVTMAAALCATLSGVLCLIADGSISPAQFWSASIDWFIGDCIGLLGFAPFLLIHIFPLVRGWLGMKESELDRARHVVSKVPVANEWIMLEAIGQTASLVVVLWIIFGPRWANLELLYLSFVPILWLAMRSGIRRVVIGSVAMNFGIVISMHLFAPAPSVLDKVGLLMLVVSGSGLIVGATVTERQQFQSELHQRTTYLKSLFENSPLGIVALNREGRIDHVNEAFTKLSLYEPDELVGKELDAVFLPEVPTAAFWSSDALTSQTLQQLTRRARKDGLFVDVELHAVPLIVDNRAHGAYAICKDISEQIQSSQAERAHAESLNRLVKELEIQTDQMTMLNEMAALLECCATTKEACAVVGQSTPKFFPGATSGTLYTFKASRNLVEAAISWGNAPSDVVFAPDGCWALRRGQPHWSQSGGVICSHLEMTRPVKHLCLPMVGHGETLGVFNLEFESEGSESQGSLFAQQRLGVTVANQIALSLASLRLRETLRDQSIRDPLTGLFNRRFMQEALEREMVRARRKNHPISVLFLDIDHFKRFNDTFGHDAGDFVLQSFADLLRGFFRGDDVACRCGGEEFAVILPESVAANAAIRADTLRNELKQLKLHYKNTRLGTVSVSIGIAAFPEHCATPDELLKVADQCLYRSKAEGRDRVTVASATEQKAAASV
jgi:diguanylate cyclase (GGDEF)-like protein/PAS domain S-box-containing protein